MTVNISNTVAKFVVYTFFRDYRIKIFYGALGWRKLVWFNR